MSDFVLARVLRVHPDSHTADLILYDTGGYFEGARVLTPFATTNTGTVDLADPTEFDPKDAPGLTGNRDMLACVIVHAHMAYVIGFIYPQVAQMMFDDHNRRISRHASDVYSTIDDDGNVEFFHPSGTYVRFGTSPDHEDLTGKDVDGEWKINKNTDKKVHLKVVVANGGEQKAAFSADPDGNVKATGKGALNADFEGDVGVSSQGEITASSPTKVTSDAPMTEVAGDLHVGGSVTCDNDISDAKGSMQEMRDHLQ
ncbi:MAG TPA: hypothetical protein VFL54_09940 [Gammaproteobacteria bacterium]|nr:hypothetical protein [Gammaproteobacteria bacterium]